MAKKDKAEAAGSVKEAAEKAEKKKAKKEKGDTVVSQTRGGMVDATAGGGNFKAEDLVGKLLLIWPLALEEGVSTAYGDSDAMRADVGVINEKKPRSEDAGTDPGKSEMIEGGLIFQKVLQSQLRQALSKGQCVLGRLTVDEASKKKGQSAPYRLATPTGADREAGQAFLDSTSPLVGA